MQKRIDALASTPAGTQLADDARAVVRHLLDALEEGSLRAAEKDAVTGEWRAVEWVKRGILLGFRVGGIIDMSIASANENVTLSFFDKDTYPPRSLNLTDGIRIVPGGSSIRRGAYVASGVVCMPPMYINVGAWVGDGTLVDSHALVGSCAQIGKRVHLSAAAQIGGVIEPVGAMPVIVEDDVLVGGNCGVYEGAIIRARAVLASGTIITGSTPVYDLPNSRIIKPEPGQPLVVPEGAVVVPGARAVTVGAGKDWGLSLATPVIVKYRDERTDARTELERWIR